MEESVKASADFDTLATSRELENAGVSRAQAEAIATAIRAGQGDLATKADLATLKADFETGIASVRADIYRAMRVQTGVIIAGVGVLLALMQFAARLPGGA